MIIKGAKGFLVASEPRFETELECQKGNLMVERRRERVVYLSPVILFGFGGFVVVRCAVQNREFDIKY